MKDLMGDLSLRPMGILVLVPGHGIFVGDLTCERSHGGSFLEARGHSSFGARA